MTAVAEATSLKARLALIACGENSRPGKTQACDTHRDKASTLLRLTANGNEAALAAAICGTGHNPACTTCTEKAARMIRIYKRETL